MSGDSNIVLDFHFQTINFEYCHPALQFCSTSLNAIIQISVFLVQIYFSMWSYVHFLIFAEVFIGKLFFFWLCDTNVATEALHEQLLLSDWSSESHIVGEFEKSMLVVDQCKRAASTWRYSCFLKVCIVSSDQHFLRGKLRYTDCIFLRDAVQKATSLMFSFENSGAFEFGDGASNCLQRSRTN